MTASASVLPALHRPSAFSFSELQPAMAFCDKKYKDIRLVVDKIKHVCLWIFYTIISSFCFSAAAAHKYERLALVEGYKSLHLSDFKKFGHELIDFSLNTFPDVKKTLPAGVTELDGLKMLYGADKVDRICEDDSSFSKYAMRREIGEGCCYGMSLDFIFSYLEHRQLGKSPLQAIKSIAPHFAHGPTEKAQLCQIMLNAGYDHAKIFKLKEGVELRKHTDNHTDYVKNVIKNNTRMKAVDFASLKPAQECLLLRVEDTDNSSKAEFETFAQKLPVGAYQVSLVQRSDDNDGISHSIVFIKTEEGIDFVFDPNVGTLGVEHDKSPDRLWNMAKCYMSENNRVYFRQLAYINPKKTEATKEFLRTFDIAKDNTKSLAAYREFLQTFDNTKNIVA